MGWASARLGATKDLILRTSAVRPALIRVVFLVEGYPREEIARIENFGRSACM